MPVLHRSTQATALYIMLAGAQMTLTFGERESG